MRMNIGNCRCVVAFSEKRWKWRLDYAISSHDDGVVMGAAGEIMGYDVVLAENQAISDVHNRTH